MINMLENLATQGWKFKTIIIIIKNCVLTRSAILATSIIELISLLHSSKVSLLFFPNEIVNKNFYLLIQQVAQTCKWLTGALRANLRPFSLSVLLWLGWCIECYVQGMLICKLGQPMVIHRVMLQSGCYKSTTTGKLNRILNNLHLK